MEAFHGHVYFSLPEASVAEKVRADLAAALPQLTYVGGLIPRPIGPHPKPMFEIHIPAGEIDDISAVIDLKRRGLSVLIHPVQEDELDAHTASARWLGTKLPLNLEFLRGL